jgi:archaellum component FlaC
MKKIVEQMNEELGFNIFIGKRYNEAYQNYIEEVNLSIKEHNEIMKKAGKDIEDLKDYLIKEPTHNTNVYEEWAEILFGEKP